MSVGAATPDAGFVIAAWAAAKSMTTRLAQHDADERSALPLERAELERSRSRLRDECRRDDKGCQQPSCKCQLHERSPECARGKRHESGSSYSRLAPANAAANVGSRVAVARGERSSSSNGTASTTDTS